MSKIKHCSFCTRPAQGSIYVLVSNLVIGNLILHGGLYFTCTGHLLTAEVIKEQLLVVAYGCLN